MGVDREALTADWEALEAAFDKVADKVAAHDCDALTTPELLAWLGRCEKLRRRLPALEHPVINTLARQGTPEELGGKLPHAIAETTLISRARASRRVREAADLGPRRGLTGRPLPPCWPTPPNTSAEASWATSRWR